GALTVWIVAEVAMFRSFHWLQAVYGALGLAILALGLWRAARLGLPRHRWVVGVTLAGATGFLGPAAAGACSAGMAGLPQGGGGALDRVDGARLGGGVAVELRARPVRGRGDAGRPDGDAVGLCGPRDGPRDGAGDVAGGAAADFYPVDIAGRLYPGDMDGMFA